MTDKIIQHQDISLFTQSFGNRSHPAVVLIAGATVSMLFWDSEFCQKLADKGLFVIRYDFRDTGQSTSVPEGEANYDIVDFTEDLLAIIDAYKIPAAHLVGISLGGMIAQIAAIKYPERVKSLCLFSTMPWGDSDIPVPEMDPQILDFHAKAADIDWENEDKVIHYLLEGSHLMSGLKPLNALRAENYLRESYRRANNFRSQFNHASIAGGMDYYNQLDKIKVPVLVIHGTEDKICHFQNAISLMQKIKAQNLVVLEGTGHELHEDDWPLIINSISNLVKTASQ